MGRIITCLGEENIGVTTTAIMLAKTISQMSKKNTLLLDLNSKKPDVYKYLSNSEEQPQNNIDLVMNYAISEKNLSAVIKNNVETLTNSKLDIIMGSNINQDFDIDQYINLLDSVNKMYDFIVIDTSIKINETIKDHSDLILFIVDQCNKNLYNIKLKHWKLLNDVKTNIVVNKYNKDICKLKTVKNIIQKEDIHKIHYDPAVVVALNNRVLNLEEGLYDNSIKEITKYILKKYSVSYKENKRFSLFGRKKEVDETDA
jgi:Flp pilus assembly CpaE family ATPase